MLERIPTKRESSEVGKVFIRRKKIKEHVDRDMGSLKVRVPQSRPLGSLNYFYGGISSGFPLANSFDLSGSQSIFGTPQDVPMRVHISRQNGFYYKGQWVEHPLASLPLGCPRSLLCLCS